MRAHTHSGQCETDTLTDTVYRDIYFAYRRVSCVVAVAGVAVVVVFDVDGVVDGVVDAAAVVVVVVHPQLVDDQAQVNPADMPILRAGIECTLTQLLDKGFLHAVSSAAVLGGSAGQRSLTATTGRILFLCFCLQHSWSSALVGLCREQQTLPTYALRVVILSWL